MPSLRQRLDKARATVPPPDQVSGAYLDEFLDELLAIADEGGVNPLRRTV